MSALTTRSPQADSLWLWRGAALLVTALAFYLRLHYLTLFQYHIDEFFTLTAVDLIAQSGLPRYPTGLLYDPGLPFSYLAGGLVWLLGFSEALVRWPAVWFGTLAVVTTYWLGERLLRWPAVGLLAALWLALSFESIQWSGRARMISLAQWLGLLAVALLWLGLTRRSARYRWVFALSYGATLLTHFSTVVLMPAWFGAAAILWLRDRLRLSWALLRDGLFLLVVFALVISSGIIFQPPPSVEFQTSDSGLDDKVGELTGKFLQIPSDVGHAWEAYGPYFIDLPHGPVLLLAGVGLALSLGRWLAGRQQSVPQDVGALFLGAIFITVLAVLVLVISPHWQRSRYLLMQAQAVFLLLGAHGLRELVGWLPSFRWRAGVATLVAMLVTIPFWGPVVDMLDDGPGGWNRYDLAFGHVADELSAGDEVMSMHPPASWLYLHQSDYYLVQSSAKLIVRSDGRLGDRYTGALWLETVDQFNRLLAERSNRIWLVSQEFWLFNSYSGDLQQQILWQMDRQWGEGGVWALVSRPDAWPLARELEIRVDARFQGGAELVGFTAEPAAPLPGQPVRLTLFWEGEAMPHGAKIFVHLRDAANQTVAQADHFIYAGKVPTSRWEELVENSPLIRDGATLQVPAELAPGPYRLLVGFYHPETFERLGVIDDQSGESAVILGEWVVD